jgi:hypothetical protein
MPNQQCIIESGGKDNYTAKAYQTIHDFSQRENSSPARSEVLGRAAPHPIMTQQTSPATPLLSPHGRHRQPPKTTFGRAFSDLTPPQPPSPIVRASASI